MNTNTQKTQHTPGPWRVERSPLPSLPSHVGISGGDHIWLAAVVARLNGQKYPEGEANAAFIVRACNNHEALVAALRSCSEALDEAKRFADSKGSLELAAFCASEAEQARAALAAAKGEDV